MIYLNSSEQQTDFEAFMSESLYFTTAFSLTGANVITVNPDSSSVDFDSTKMYIEEIFGVTGSVVDGQIIDNPPADFGVTASYLLDINQIDADYSASRGL